MKLIGKLVTSLSLACVGSVAFGAAPYRDLRDFFGASDGATPLASLVADSKGFLYGTTAAGGAFSAGTVFRVTLPKSPTGPSTTEIVYSFDGVNGSIPEGGVTIGPDGALYGSTNAGGAHNVGTIFRLDPKTFVLTKLHDFDPTSTPRDGTNPIGGLTVGPNNLLYGTTAANGLLGYGTFFSISPKGTGYKTLHDFGAAGDGADPNIGRLVGSGNKLYGVTNFGGNFNGYGTAYEMALTPGTNTWTETVIHVYGSGTSQVFLPANGVVLDKDGSLYGCGPGGRFARGAVYKLTPVGGGAPWAQTVIKDFEALDDPAAGPYCTVVIEPSTGRLVGTSSGGGTFGQGTIFTLTKSGGAFTVVHHYGAVASEPSRPAAPLLGVGQGIYIGTLATGGDNIAQGGVFGVKP